MRKHHKEFLKKLSDSYYENMAAVKEDPKNGVTWIVPIKKMLIIYWSKIDGGLDYISDKSLRDFELDRYSIINHINNQIREHKGDILYHLRNYEAKVQNIRYDDDWISHWNRINLDKSFDNVLLTENIQIWLTKKGRYNGR